jgi:hypothetical protein
MVEFNRSQMHVVIIVVAALALAVAIATLAWFAFGLMPE